MHTEDIKIFVEHNRVAISEVSKQQKGPIASTGPLQFDFGYYFNKVGIILSDLVPADYRQKGVFVKSQYQPEEEVR